MNDKTVWIRELLQVVIWCLTGKSKFQIPWLYYESLSS